jgi:DNA-binding CsgD family transcriptional regulator
MSNVQLSLDKSLMSKRIYPSFPEVVQSTQSRLRDYLFGSQGRIAWHPARDLAAHMLLFIDDSKSCSAIAVEWIRNGLGCSRVDTGLGLSSDSAYFPGYAESRDPDTEVQTYAGATVNNTADAMQLMWLSQRPTVFVEVADDSRFDIGLRNLLVNAGTKSKMAAPVAFRGKSVGLICADWVGRTIPNSSLLYEHYESVVCEVLGPILVSSHELDSIRVSGSMLGPNNIVRTKEELGTILSTAELNVAQLAASGLPYKVIADRLNKSFSTVDHQLRSIRRKLKVRTYAELASVLACTDE